MLDRLRQTIGYYAVLVTFMGIFCGLVIYLIFSYTKSLGALKDVNIDTLRLLTAAPIVLSAFSVFFFNFLSIRVRQRVQWLMKQPAMNQFYVLLATEFITVVTLGVIRANVQYPLIAAFDISFNLIYTLFGFVVLGLAIRLFFNPKKS